MPRTFVWHPGKGPKLTEKNTLTSGQVEIRQVRSKIGHSWRMRRTLEAMGIPLVGGIKHGVGQLAVQLGPRPHIRNASVVAHDHHLGAAFGFLGRSANFIAGTAYGVGHAGPLPTRVRAQLRALQNGG